MNFLREVCDSLFTRQTSQHYWARVCLCQANRNRYRMPSCLMFPIHLSKSGPRNSPKKQKCLLHVTVICQWFGRTSHSYGSPSGGGKRHRQPAEIYKYGTSDSSHWSTAYFLNQLGGPWKTEWHFWREWKEASATKVHVTSESYLCWCFAGLVCKHDGLCHYICLLPDWGKRTECRSMEVLGDHLPCPTYLYRFLFSHTMASKLKC